jgi:FkbM family methyltransferase
MYDLLPELLKSETASGPYAVLLKHLRETTHPVGKKDIRALRTASGLTLSVDLSERLGCGYFYGYLPDRSDFDLLTALIQPGDVVVDVGAHCGLYALEAALRTTEKGRVIAIEPDARSFNLLEQNIDRNQLRPPIQSLSVCAGNADGRAPFHLSVEASFSGVRDTGRAAVEKMTQVDLRSLDSLLDELEISKIDVLKIDAEGSDTDVLEGAGRILRSGDPVVMFEISLKNIDEGQQRDARRTLSELQAQGYVAYGIINAHLTAVACEDLFRPDASGGKPLAGNFFLAKQNSMAQSRFENQFAALASSLNRKRYLLRGKSNQHQLPLSEKIGHRRLETLGNAVGYIIEHFVDRLDQCEQNRMAHAALMEKMSDDLTAMRNGKQGYKELLNRTNDKLLRTRANIDGFKEMIRQTTAELQQARSDREALAEVLADSKNEKSRVIDCIESTLVRLERAKAKLEETEAAQPDRWAHRESIAAEIERTLSELSYCLTSLNLS